MFVKRGVWNSEDVEGRWLGVLSDCSYASSIASTCEIAATFSSFPKRGW